MITDVTVCAFPVHTDRQIRSASANVLWVTIVNKDNRHSSGSALSQAIDPAVTASTVEAIAVRPPRFLTFPKIVEAQFERDTGAERCRQLIWRGALAVILLDLFSMLDYLTIPDAFHLSVQLRFGVVTTFALAVILVLRRNPTPFVRETLEGLISVITAMVLMILTVATESPLKSHFAYGLILVVMFVTAVQTIRFWYALATCAGIVATYFLFAARIEPDVQAQMALVPGLLTGAAALCLISSYALEREHRIAYLKNLLQRLHTGRLENLSSHDPLTGLGNRRALDHMFESLRPKDGHRRLLSAVLIDIDHFKAFNDTFGHLAGDQCLKTVADLLHTQYRSGEGSLFRFGGEEFVLLVADVDGLVAADIAARMRLALLRSQIPHCKPQPNSVVTASFGVASMTIDATSTLAPLLLAADAALYRAKGSGRNRVVVSGAPVEYDTNSAMVS